MKHPSVESLVRAVLYEGYVLYPYRASSIKNRQRFTFGTLYPPGWCAFEPFDACTMHTELLVRGKDARVLATARFLQLVTPREGWHEAEERDATAEESRLADLVERPHVYPFAFSPGHGVTQAPTVESERGAGRECGEEISGTVTLAARRLGDALYRLRVAVKNETPLGSADSRDTALLRALASTHVLVTVEDGEPISLLDPPEELREQALACTQEGAWPVLVGRASMLASPVILYDQPRIAKESPGDLFDGTEIDEILTLRILTLTEEEKREVRATDPRARALLDRTEALGTRELMKLHGAMRSRLSAGDRVRIAPRGRADALDVVLRGKIATVRTLEEDAEGRVFATVTVDEDPGQDFGVQGLPGHRFFFQLDDLERLS